MCHVLKAYYLAGHGGGPVILYSAEDVDALIDAVGVSGPAHRLVTIYLFDHPLNAAGFPDHEVGVGVDAARGVGAVTYFGKEGNFYSLGPRKRDGEVSYAFMGNSHHFPSDSEIPLETVRQVVKEFMATGKFPECIAWQSDPFRSPMPAESPYF